MTNLKTVTLNLAPVNVQVTGNTPEELLENAKKAFIDQLTAETMPGVTSYSVGEAGALDFSTVYEGQIVANSKGELGIVNQVNKKTIFVTYASGRTVSAPPVIFKASDATFEEARSRRNDGLKKENFWHTGDTGYIKLATGTCAVVVGKVTKAKAKLHVVGTRKFVGVSHLEMERLLKEEKSEIN